MRGMGQTDSITITGYPIGNQAAPPSLYQQDLNQLPLGISDPLASFAQAVCVGAGCNTPSPTSSTSTTAPSLFSGSTLTVIILAAVALVGMLVAKGGR
jgi:hypothetical protein